MGPGAALAAPFAFIGNSLDATVSVIDTATPETEARTIPIAGEPLGIATNPTRIEAYAAVVTEEGDSALSVIVGVAEGFAEVAVIPLGVFDPKGVAINPAGTRAWVTGGFEDNQVSVVNLDTRSETATIALGNDPLNPVGPVGVAVNPALPKLYVANFNTGTVSVIDTIKNAVTSTITLAPCPAGCAPLGVAVSPDGSRVYVTDYFADTVWVINAATNTVVTGVTTDIFFPEGVAVNPAGSLVYVANLDTSGNGRLTVIRASDNTVVDSTTVGHGPLGVAVHPLGTSVYVVNTDDDTVTVASTADLTSQTTVPVGGAPTAFGQFITPVPASIRLSSAVYGVTEGTTNVNATVTILRTGAPGATITVPVATVAGGTATAGADYTNTSKVVTFGPNDTSQTVQITIRVDSAVEGLETVAIALGTPTGLATLEQPSTAVIQIRDRERRAHCRPGGPQLPGETPPCRH